MLPHCCVLQSESVKSLKCTAFDPRITPGYHCIAVVFNYWIWRNEDGVGPVGYRTLGAVKMALRGRFECCFECHFRCGFNTVEASKT